MDEGTFAERIAQQAKGLGGRIGRSKPDVSARLPGRVGDPLDLPDGLLPGDNPVDGDGDRRVFDSTRFERDATPEELARSAVAAVTPDKVRDLAVRATPARKGRRHSPFELVGIHDPMRRRRDLWIGDDGLQQQHAELERLRDPSIPLEPKDVEEQLDEMARSSSVIDRMRSFIRDLDDLEGRGVSRYGSYQLTPREHAGIRTALGDVERLGLILRRAQLEHPELVKDAEDLQRRLDELERTADLLDQKYLKWYDDRIRTVAEYRQLEKIIDDVDTRDEAEEIQRVLEHVRDKGDNHHRRAVAYTLLDKLRSVKGRLPEDATRPVPQPRINSIFQAAKVKQKRYWRERLEEYSTRLRQIQFEVNNFGYSPTSIDDVEQVMREAEEVLARIDGNADRETVKSVDRMIRKLRAAADLYTGKKKPSRRREKNTKVDVEELDRKADELVQNAIERRAAQVGKHMEQVDTSAALTQQELEDAIEGAYRGDSEAQEELEIWVEATFGHHNGTETRGGIVFHTYIDEIEPYADGSDRQLSVRGIIYAENPESGQEERVGDFERTIHPGSHQVAHDHLYMGDDADYVDDDEFANDVAKNSGFVTLFNGQAMYFYRKAGIKRVDLSTASDGRYVWGRVGFRPPPDQERRSHQNLVGKFRTELDKFNRGKDSIIEDVAQAVLIRRLIERAEEADYGPDSPSFMEFSLVLDPASADKERSEKVGNWFKNQAPLGVGVLWLDR